MTKTCPKCGDPKAEFYVKKGGGYQGHCKNCQRAAANKWAADNRSQRKRTAKRYRKKNKAKIAEYNRQWCLDHPRVKKSMIVENWFRSKLAILMTDSDFIAEEQSNKDDASGSGCFIPP